MLSDLDLEFVVSLHDEALRYLYYKGVPYDYCEDVFQEGCINFWRGSIVSRPFFFYTMKFAAIAYFAKNDAFKRGGRGQRGVERKEPIQIVSLDVELWVEDIPESVDVRSVENIVILREFIASLSPSQRKLALDGYLPNKACFLENQVGRLRRNRPNRRRAYVSL